MQVFHYKSITYVKCTGISSIIEEVSTLTPAEQRPSLERLYPLSFRPFDLDEGSGPLLAGSQDGGTVKTVANSFTLLPGAKVDGR